MSLLKRKPEILATLLSLVALIGTAPAQLRPQVKWLETPDGSRFILIPSGSSPLIHWVQSTPAGAAEDPAAYPGLSFAVARASLNGTSEIGSQDWPAEALALQTREDFELDRRRITEEGGIPNTTLLSEIDKHRMIADRISDDHAWRRKILRAPAIDLQLSEAEAASLLAITTTKQGFPKVARMLEARKTKAALRGLRENYNQIQSERARQQRHPLSALRREILELAQLGRGRASEPLAANLYRAGKEIFQRSQSPERCLHVIAGGFDLTELKVVLMDVFKGDGESAHAPIKPSEQISRKERLRESVIPGGNRQAIAIAYEIPQQASKQAFAVLIDWLTKGPDSFLARNLRERGHDGLQIRGQAPFPGTTIPSLMLIEIWEERMLGIGRSEANLIATIKELLETAAKTGPSPKEFNQAIARARGQRSMELASPLELAHHVALSCGVLGLSPEAAMQATIQVSRKEILALANMLLLDSRCSLVNSTRQR